MSAGRRFTDAERLSAVAAARALGSPRRAAELLGIERRTLALWCQGRRHRELMTMRASAERQLADAIERTARLLLAGSADPAGDAAAMAGRLRAPEPEAARA